MDELKPCPWCRKPPKTCPDNSYGAALVFCPDANECDVSPMVEADLNAGETLDDAIRRWNSWNTRPAPSPADAGLVERLRERDEEEAYQIGKREGYEEAIQDLDLATGGDGEYQGSTMLGCTVDVPAMKARIVARIEALSGEYERGVERLLASLPEVVEADERLSQAMLDNTSCEEAGAPDGLLAYRTMVLCAYNDLRIILAFVDKARKAIRALKAGAPNEENDHA